MSGYPTAREMKAQMRRNMLQAERERSHGASTVTIIDDIHHEPLTAEQHRAIKTRLEHRIIQPAYIGGRSWYGRQIDLERDRAVFLRILIRGLRP